MPQMRIVFRLIEFSDGVGSSNRLVGDEIYPFMLDAFPMLLALVLLNVIHPGLVLRGPDSEFPRKTRAEKKALKAQKKQDKEMRKMAKKARKNGEEHEPKVDSYGARSDSDADRSLMV